MAALNGKEFKNILVIGAIGIGNLLIFRPALTALRKRFDSARFTILVLRGSFAEVLKHDALADEILVADIREYGSLPKKMALVSMLRRRKFDLAVTTFPANRAGYNILAFMTGAPVRVAHSYPRKKLKSFSFLQNVRVAVQPGIHDVEQNLGLLEPFGITWHRDEVRFEFPLLREEYLYGEQFLEEHGLRDGRPLIGIHPGSSAEHLMVHKRWPARRFSGLVDALREEHNGRVLIFGGPDEEEIKQEVKAGSSADPVLVSGISLRQTAAVIRQCKLFVSNDSGLMHIAVGMGVRTVGIFGPTDDVRTAPYGSEHRVVRKGEVLWKLEDVGIRKGTAEEARRSIEAVEVEDVMEEARRILPKGSE